MRRFIKAKIVCVCNCVCVAVGCLWLRRRRRKSRSSSRSSRRRRRFLQALEQICVRRGVDETRVRVSLHQGVDLLLGVLKGVRGGLQHVAVDDLSDSGVQTDLEDRMGRKGPIRKKEMKVDLKKQWFLHPGYD